VLFLWILLKEKLGMKIATFCMEYLEILELLDNISSVHFFSYNILYNIIEKYCKRFTFWDLLFL